QGLHSLAEAHVVGENASAPDLVQEPEPLEALLLVRSKLRFEVARLAGFFDFVDVLELAEYLPGVARHARSPHLGKQVLDAPDLRQRKPPPIASARGQDLRLALEHLANFQRVEASE